MKSIVPLLFVMISICMFRGSAFGQTASSLNTSGEPIPQSYKSWSLFLVNNPQWLVSESNEKIKKLYNQFEAFGRAIGDDHVAVWFWSKKALQDPSYYKAVDVTRSAAFCKKLNLPPS